MKGENARTEATPLERLLRRCRGIEPRSMVAAGAEREVLPPLGVVRVRGGERATSPGCTPSRELRGPTSPPRFPHAMRHPTTSIIGSETRSRGRDRIPTRTAANQTTQTRSGPTGKPPEAPFNVRLADSGAASGPRPRPFARRRRRATRSRRGSWAPRPTCAAPSRLAHAAERGMFWPATRLNGCEAGDPSPRRHREEGAPSRLSVRRATGSGRTSVRTCPARDRTEQPVRPASSDPNQPPLRSQIDREVPVRRQHWVSGIE